MLYVHPPSMAKFRRTLADFISSAVDRVEYPYEEAPADGNSARRE